MKVMKFIIKTRTVHGDKDGYLKMNYVNDNMEVCITCPDHEYFWQMPHIHLISRGCCKCYNGMEMKAKDFIRKAKLIHGNKYDYSKVKYINDKVKVCIICPEHGEFWQSPQEHLISKGCVKCHNASEAEKFIKKARIIHNNKYDYSKVEFVDMNTKVCICSEYGEFWQTPNVHLRGHVHF